MSQNHDARKISTQLTSQFGGITEHPRPDSREAWEKEQYACHYNYLFPLLKENRLPYDKVGKRTGLKERRIEEVLVFRLKPTSQKSQQLFGYREGNCYVCNVRMQPQAEKEPICLKCLHAIEIACLEIAEDEALLSQSTEQAADGFLEEDTVKEDDTREVTAEVSMPEASPEVEVPLASEEPVTPEEPLVLEAPPDEALPEMPVGSPSGEMVPIEQLLAVQAELAQYKKHFGELPSVLTDKQPTAGEPSAISAATEQASSPQAAETVTPSLPDDVASPLPRRDNETEQLLRLLDVDDRELATETAELAKLMTTILPPGNSPLRHFGFLRSKSYKAT